MTKILEKMIQDLESGAAIIEPKDGLRTKLTEANMEGRPLRIKLGFDPTAPDLHLGHAVVAKKLRQFQDHGHLVVVIIGDYTARRGDPTGCKDTRPSLTKKQVDANAITYLNQIGLMLDLAKIEVQRNSKWYDNKGFGSALDLAEQFNIGRLFERKDFGDRYKSGQSVTLAELMYPGLQGHDSVEIKADVEIGGTDQLYNMLVGRDLQRKAEQEPQVVLCMPILQGTDGIIKMSKSKGNYIGLAESPEAMFQKIMGLKDRVFDGDKEIQVVRSFVELLVTDVAPRQELLGKILAIEQGVASAQGYVEVKKSLAFDIVRQFHGKEKAMLALQSSERIQQLKLGSATLSLFMIAPDVIQGGIKLQDLCRQMLVGKMIEPVGSNNPRKLIESGAVKINERQHKNINQIIYPEPGMVIAIGKKLAFQIQTVRSDINSVNDSNQQNLG